MNTVAQKGLRAQPGFHEFPDTHPLADALAVRLADALMEDVERKGRAGLVVSGGSTPRPLFARLRRIDIPWSRVWITLADERWVSADAPESNERMVRAELLQDCAAEAQFIGLKTPHAEPEGGVALAERKIEPVPRPFSAVVLGMGGDGHTASLFPYADGLARALDPANPRAVAALRPKGEGAAALPRLTLTLSALTDSRLVILHITGAEKRAAYERALAGGDILSMPVRAVLGGRDAPVEVWWAPWQPDTSWETVDA